MNVYISRRKRRKVIGVSDGPWRDEHFSSLSLSDVSHWLINVSSCFIFSLLSLSSFCSSDAECSNRISMVMDVNDRSVNVERFDSHINASEVNCDKNERLGHDDGN